jgi:hypothetical protein
MPNATHPKQPNRTAIMAMHRILLPCAALALLAAAPHRSHAATLMACQDADGQDWPVSPQHPCPISGGAGSSNTTAATPPGTSATSANPVQGVPNGVPIPVSQASGNYGNGGITIVAANVSQQAIAAGGAPHGCDIINPGTATEPLFFSIGSTAGVTFATPSLAPGTTYHCPVPPGTGQAVNVAAATVGHTATFIAY